MALSVPGGRGFCLTLAASFLGGLFLLLLLHICFPLHAHSSALIGAAPFVRVETPEFVACGPVPARVFPFLHRLGDDRSAEDVRYVSFGPLSEGEESPRPRDSNELVWYSVIFRLDEVLDRSLRNVRSLDLELSTSPDDDVPLAVVHAQFTHRIPECPELADARRGLLNLVTRGEHTYHRASLLLPPIPEGTFLNVRVAVAGDAPRVNIHFPRLTTFPEDGIVALFSDETDRGGLDGTWLRRGVLEVHDPLREALSDEAASNSTGAVSVEFSGDTRLVFARRPLTLAPYEGRESAVGEVELEFELDQAVEIRPGQRFSAAVRSFSRNVEITLFYEYDSPKSVTRVLWVDVARGETAFSGFSADRWSRIDVPLADFYAAGERLVTDDRITGFRFRNVRPEKGRLAVDDVYLA